MTRTHTIRLPGLDLLGDVAEGFLRLPVLRRLTRLRKRLSHSRAFSHPRQQHMHPAWGFVAGLVMAGTFIAAVLR